MAKIKKWDISDGTIGWIFKCPGCKARHLYIIGFESEEGKQRYIDSRKWSFPNGQHCPTWTFNGDVNRPTFSPSFLISWNERVGTPDQTKFVCHSFVTDGKIQFCGDCTHSLVGQTVDLPNIEE